MLVEGDGTEPFVATSHELVCRSDDRDQERNCNDDDEAAGVSPIELT